MATRALVVTGYAPAELRRAVAAALAVAMAEKAPAVKVDTERVYEPDEESTAMRGGAILVAIDDAAGVFARKKYPYNVRAIATATSTAESLTAYVLEGLLNQPMRRFVSSRADLHPATPGPTVGFLSAVRRGIAPDGGLFLPEHLPPRTRATSWSSSARPRPPRTTRRWPRSCWSASWTAMTCRPACCKP
jgi:hypothetical protein